MRKLFTTFIALCATMAMSAQDTSEWQPEQEVTEDLLWQNTKYEGDESGWVYYNAQEGSNGRGLFYDASKSATGSVEMYNNAIGSEYYQVLWLPAGYYKFTVQGFYRPGSAWAAGWDTNTDQNGIFFCDEVTEVENEEGLSYETTRENSTKLRLIVSDAHEGAEKVLTDEMCGDWQRDNGFTRDGIQYWVPNSMWGTCLYFAMGNYENELMVVHPEDGYVKIGIRKGPDHIGDDWIIFNNFRAFYISDAGEAVQLLLAQDEVYKTENKATALQDKLADEYGGLAALMGDALMEIQDGAEYNSTIEECQATVIKINDLVAQYNVYYTEAKSLSALLVKCRTLNSTAGDATFAAAVAAAEDIENNGTGQYDLTIDTPEAYKQAAEALAEARVAYLTSQPAVDGAWDFTTMVNFPWFCNEEYNPTYNAEEGRWYFPEYVLNGDETHAGYGNYFEGNATYAGGKTDDGVPYLIIADKVKLNSKPTAGEWYKVGPAGHECYWNHQYSSAKAWATPGDNREIKQDLTGLPTGFYSAKALSMTWGNDWDKDGIDPANTCRMGIYIETSSEKSVSTEEPIFSGWWQGGHPFDWQTYTTNMVHVTDGTCSVAFFSNGFSSHTGMQLFYYGENPDFTSMIKPEVEAVKAIELRLAGDIAHVAALLASLPETINGYDEYVSARNIVEEAKAYANASVAYMATWDASDKFMELQSNYDEGSDEYAMLDPTWYKTLSFEEEPDATYLGAQAISNDYNAYVNYFSTRNEMMKVADANAELKALLEQQCAEIKNAYTTAATFESYIAALSAPYNVAILASLGVDKATEANPVDITQLLNNPSFDEGKNGWEGDFTADANYKNAEVYNTNSFRVAQTIYNLPAGSYRVQVQSFYRDGGSAQDAYNNLYAEELAAFYEDETMAEKSYSANVKLFANYNATDVVSIASEKFFEPSMTERIDSWEEDLEATEAYHDEHFNDPDYDPEYKAMKPVYAYIDMISPAYPFDQNMYDEADSFEEIWYPNSMEGAMNRFQKNPAAYINTVDVSITETGNLTFGLEKLEGIGSDWCIFDNFKLFCISTDPAVGINSVADTKAAATSIYTVNGIRQNTLTRGVNIVKTSDGTVKKVVK